MPTPSKRAKLVYEALRAARWISVSDIMKVAALRDQRNRRLAPDALRVAIKRALNELIALGMAETKTELDDHGVANRLARRRARQAAFIAEDKNVSAHVDTQ